MPPESFVVAHGERLACATTVASWSLALAAPAHQWRKRQNPNEVISKPRNRVMPIVQNIDAATESQVTIDDTQFAMQTSPSTGDQKAQGPKRGVNTPHHTRFIESSSPLFAQTRASPHRPPPPTPSTLFGQPSLVLQPPAHPLRESQKYKFRGECANGQHQWPESALEKLCATLQQLDLMAIVQRWTVFHRSNFATKGKWSDMRCQILPCGTI